MIILIHDTNGVISVVNIELMIVYIFGEYWCKNIIYNIYNFLHLILSIRDLINF